jgi:integrase
MRIPDHRMPNRDLEDLVDLILGTGCREGEALAIRRCDLDLDGPLPLLHVGGTIVNPRGGYVTTLHRQDWTKTREDRTLILPDAVVEMLQGRLSSLPADDETPIFRARTGNWLHPANLRTRLRTALERAGGSPTELDRAINGTTFHTLRRTVGTLIAHEVSLDAARDQLGHRDPSITFRHYVGRRETAPDLRPILASFLGPLR